MWSLKTRSRLNRASWHNGTTLREADISSSLPTETREELSATGNIGECTVPPPKISTHQGALNLWKEVETGRTQDAECYGASTTNTDTRDGSTQALRLGTTNDEKVKPRERGPKRSLRQCLQQEYIQESASSDYMDLNKTGLNSQVSRDLPCLQGYGNNRRGGNVGRRECRVLLLNPPSV